MPRLLTQLAHTRFELSRVKVGNGHPQAIVALGGLAGERRALYKREQFGRQQIVPEQEAAPAAEPGDGLRAPQSMVPVLRGGVQSLFDVDNGKTAGNDSVTHGVQDVSLYSLVVGPPVGEAGDVVAVQVERRPSRLDRIRSGVPTSPHRGLRLRRP